MCKIFVIGASSQPLQNILTKPSIAIALHVYEIEPSDYQSYSDRGLEWDEMFHLFSPWNLGLIMNPGTVMESASHKDSKTLPIGHKTKFWLKELKSKIIFIISISVFDLFRSKAEKYALSLI